MKKIILLIIAVITIFSFNTGVKAASASLGVSSGSVYAGSNFTVSVYVKSAAAWNIHVSASGPVSGCSISQADASANALNTNKTFSASCRATGTGTITVNLSGDVTDQGGGNVGVGGSKNVTVTQRPATNNNNNSSNNNYTNPVTNNSNNNNNQNDNKSKNNNLKSIKVDNYELKKVDNNNYTLTVSNDVDNITIKASAEDSKAKVTGDGKHSLKVGENNIKVVIKSESGSDNTINVKVTRKDGYYLDDLDKVLKNDKLTDINIIIKSDTTISKSDLEKIKDSNKIVNFNYYNKDKKLLYSWIVDGNKLSNINDINTNITTETNNKKDILRLSNYADGLYYSIKQSNIPKGVKIKLYVGDKYEDGSKVNIYSYITNNDKLDLIQKKIKVVDGYIEFDAISSDDYFVTMSDIPTSTEVVNEEDNSNVLFIIIGIGVLILIGAIIFFITKKKKDKKEEVPTIQDVPKQEVITNTTPIENTVPPTISPSNTQPIPVNNDII